MLGYKILAPDAMIIGIILSAITIYLLYYIYTRPPKLNLPGPRGLPLLGNLLQLDPKNPHLRLTDLADRHGGVYVLRLLSENWVVVSDRDLLHEILVQKGMSYAGRPTNIFRINYATFCGKDIVFNQPNVRFWSVARKCAQHSLKMYKGGLTDFEYIVTSITSRFIQKQRSHGGVPRDPTDDIYNYTLSIILHFVINRELDESNEIFALSKQIERRAVQAVSFTGRGTELDMFPWLRFFGNWTYHELTEVRQLILTLWDRVKPLVVDQMDRDNPSSMAELLILAQETEKDENGHPEIQDINLCMAMTDVLIAGITTTSHTLLALIGVLLHKPEIMRRLQKEIDAKIGSERPVSLQDRDHMPYTRAAMYEILRYSTISPLGAPHVATKDNVLAGAHIPKGTTILTNLWHLHHDEKFWEDPYDFRPDRFLDERGEIVPPDHPNRKHFLSFGAGTRVCAGEVFAMARLFIIIASMLQHFDVLPDPDSNFPSCDPRKYTMGAALSPVIGKIRLVPRMQ